MKELVPPEWADAYATWKRECVNRMSSSSGDTQTLEKAGQNHSFLDDLLAAFSQWWYFFRVYDTIPSGWWPGEIQDLKPVVYRLIERKREKRSKSISKDQVEAVLDAIGELVGPKCDTVSRRGPKEKLVEKYCLHSLRARLSDREIADLLQLFFPDRFPFYTYKNVSDLLRGFHPTKPGTPA